MKKILSSLLVFAVILSSMTPVFAQENYSEYLPRVKKAIAKMTPEEKNALQKKVATAISNTEDEEIKKFLKSIDVIFYEEELNNLFKDILETENEGIIEEPQEIIEVSNYTELSSLQQRAVSYEISKLQDNLENETQELLSQMITSWNSLTNYTEKWSVTAKMDMNIEDFGSAQAGMNISEYMTQNQVFDSSISADISGYFNANSKYVDEVEFSWETDLEFIQKWQNTYLLMNNTQVNTNDESIEIELTPMLEKLTQLARDNTYIAFGDENGINPYEMFGYFSEENIQTELEMLFSENLMEAYTMNENGYLLRPTKHFCDSGKRLTNVFDPFNGKQCSEKQYQNMLEDFMDSGTQITLITDSETTLNISNITDVNAYEIVDINLIWKNASFNEMTMNLKDNYDDTEYMSAHYIANDMLKIHVPEQPYDPEFMLDMDFNRNWTIDSIDLQSSYEDEVVFIGKYDNGSLTTSLEIDTPDMQASCSFAWSAYANYLKISGDCDIASYLIDTDSESLRIDSSLLYNWAGSKNDFNWSFKAISDENNYLNFDVMSEAQRLTSNTYEIIAPTSTISYLDFLKEVSPESSYYYDDYEYETDYEYEYSSYDEYDEACYIYDSGNTTCYEYYDNKTVTCEFSIDSGEEVCDTYDYGYDIEETSFDDFDRVCYNYDSGDRTCYDYYDDKDITCEYLIETDEETCETYEYDYYDDDYYDDDYYDKVEDAEDAKDAMEQ